MKPESNLKTALDVATTVLGLTGYVYALGGIVVWVRLTAAHLPADLTTTLLDPRLLLAVGVRTLVFAVFTLAIVCFVAWVTTLLGWWGRWHTVATEPKADVGWWGRWHAVQATTEAKRRERLIRMVAGLDLLALSFLLSVAVAAAVRAVVPSELIIVIAAVAWLIAAVLVARFGAVLFTMKYFNVVIAVVVGLAALFCEFPIAVLMVTVVVIALLGRAIAKLPRPRSLFEFLRSPLPWALGAVYAVVAFGFVATPPVGYPRAVVQTDQGEKVGG